MFIKIISWNIRQGGGSRVKNIVQFLLDSQPDVIVLSEYRNNKKGAFIRSELNNSGYRYQAVTAAESEENSVLIASKYPGDSVLHLDSDPNYGNNIVEFNLGPFSVFGGYFPHKKKHVLFNHVLKLTKADHPFVLCGDLNTGINGVDQKGDSFWYEDEFKELLDGNMVDTYRICHGDKQDYSWYSHQGNGYRYDHSLISRDIAFLVESCDYLHDARELGLSDHSAMLLILRPRGEEEE